MLLGEHVHARFVRRAERMRIGRGVIPLLMSLAIPESGLAQLGNVTSLVDRMEAISVYPIIPIIRAGGNYSRTGYGFEFSFRIGEWKEDLSLAERQARCARLNAEVPGRCNPVNTADTTLTISSIRRSGAAAETTFTVSVEQLEYTK